MRAFDGIATCVAVAVSSTPSRNVPVVVSSKTSGPSAGLEVQVVPPRSGNWVPLTNQPTYANAMNLLTDGTVLVQELQTAKWWSLTPDASGSYVNGTWSRRATSHNGPTYYASSVLPDGRFLIAGGEDNFVDNNVDLDAAEIYDPVANSDDGGTWTAIGTPGWGWIGDAPACMLPNGKFIMGSINDNHTAIYDYTTNTWTAGPDKNDACSEETWTLLPDGTVLVAEVDGNPAAEKYVLCSNSWVSAGSLPDDNTLVLSSEIGPAILLPNGTVFAIGATGHTAIYTPPALPSKQGTWTGGPDFPSDANGQPMRAFDAPAVLLPNGKVLCIAGPAQADGWAGKPSHAYEYDGTNLNPVPDPPNAASKETWQYRLLLLPTGEVLCSTCDTNIKVYQPDGAPNQAWVPKLVNAPASISPGHRFAIQGTLLNGLSQANSYGDDAQMATNFPIVRLTASNGQVYYCRTSNFSTMGVATGDTIVSATVSVPGTVPLGRAQMCVVANGIPSANLAVQVVPLSTGVPTAIILSPTNVSIPDNSLAGTVIATASVTMSDGSQFTGTLTSSDTSGIFAISGMSVVTGRALTAADDGPHATAITATQNGAAVKMRLAI
jgi:hypothetical protein